ncbi:MAG: helix-turn-helix domain-containing protein [Acidobacteriaceae bacterium]
MDSGKLYSVEDAAAFLGGISKYTIHSWLSSGKLRRTKIGARTMISERDLRAFIATCNPEPEATPNADSSGANVPNVQ